MSIRIKPTFRRRPREGVETAPSRAPTPELLQCIERARRGEIAAQTRLVGLYQVRLAGFVRGMLRRQDGVEDAVQDVLIKLVRRLPRLREPLRFESWLFALARNSVLDRLRRMRRQPALQWDHAAWLRAPDPADGSRLQELLEALDQASLTFTPVERRIFERIVAGASYEAIARQERMTVGAIKARVHRLRCRLREHVPMLLGAEPAERPAA